MSRARLVPIACALLALTGVGFAAQYNNPNGSVSPGFVPEIGGQAVGPSNPLPVAPPANAPGSSPTTPTYTTPAGVTRVRTVWTLPQYSSGGTAVGTTYNTDGTTTVSNVTCAANTACKIADPLPARKLAEFTNRTQNSTIDIGYTPNLAPGFGKGYDGPNLSNGQGGSGSETSPPHVGAYYAATATAGAVLVFVQGQ